MDGIKLGINMAGAVSAGAYTAGVLDFLIEALDEWHAAKDSGQPVPMHDLSLEVLSGASAGGMCAAIASVQIQEKFDHIKDLSAVNTTNRFYESWVNKIDIRELLKTTDVGSGNVVSLLDSSIIQQIAAYALQPGGVVSRKYISPHLTLFLTLTNVQGVPYLLSSDASGSLEEYVAYHGDRIRFELVTPGAPPLGRAAHPLPVGRPGEGAWPLLQQAAMATGAVPGALAPRVIERNVSDYKVPGWESFDDTLADVSPAWKLTADQTWRTLNVDGGTIDNNPFDLAEDYLATLDPPFPAGNPSNSLQASRAVLSIAPFPSGRPFDAAFDPAKNAQLQNVIPTLLDVLLTQSRFSGESLASVASGVSFSRFAIAPSDAAMPDGKALQCGALGAFGGFFDRGYRAHDYQLGRRNCQRFLERRFLLPATNVVMAAGLAAAGANQAQVVDKFKQPPPSDYATPRDVPWIPVIPLCGSALEEVFQPGRATVTDKDLDDITSLILHRAKTLLPLLMKNLSSGVIRVLIDGGLEVYLSTLGKSELKRYLRKSLE